MRQKEPCDWASWTLQPKMIKW